MLVKLDPSEKISWSWNQKADKDVMVTSGEYEVCVNIVELGETCLKFVISEVSCFLERYSGRYVDRIVHNLPIFQIPKNLRIDAAC